MIDCRRTRWFLIVALIAAMATRLSGQVPRGYRWTSQHPFEKLAAVASSEQTGRWPASRAVDGDTSVDSMWLTYRSKRTSKPTSAWLEIILPTAQRVSGVSIFHQLSPRSYRSIDYTIACRVGNDWKQVIQVQGNEQTAWRNHRFEPVKTNRIRIVITKAEYGHRMGLNEVDLDITPKGGDADTAVVLSPPFQCGKVTDLGVLTYNAAMPAGTIVSLRTRTARDAGGRPAKWSTWSKPYQRTGVKITSPLGEWIQWEARCRAAGDRAPVLEEVTVGSPAAIRSIEIEAALVPHPGDEVNARVHFDQAMDTTRELLAELVFPKGLSQELRGGVWNSDARTWVFRPQKLGRNKGLARLVIGGARTQGASLIMHHEEPFVVGSEPICQYLEELAEWLLEQPAGRQIFYEGYKHRTLLGLYEITGRRRYLDAAHRGANAILEAQTPEGFWPTGYGSVYLADTGCALSLLVNIYKFASRPQRKRIEHALDRYAHFLLVKGDRRGKPFVHSDGSVGAGFRRFRKGKVSGDWNTPYRAATSLTGCGFFAAMHYMKGDSLHRKIATKACDWMLNSDYDNSMSPYSGEGLLQAWTYIEDLSLRKRIEEDIEPHIKWLLRMQNSDGSWGRHDTPNRSESRTHGIVNTLLWYYRNVRRDPRIADAVRRYYLLLLDGYRRSYITVATRDPSIHRAWNRGTKVPVTRIATAMAGRALVEILAPGVDCHRWKNKK